MNFGILGVLKSQIFQLIPSRFAPPIAETASPGPVVSVPTQGSWTFLDFVMFFKFSFSRLFLLFLVVFEGPDLSKQLREVISCKLVLFRSKSEDLGPKNDEKTVLKKISGTTIKGTSIKV